MKKFSFNCMHEEVSIMKQVITTLFLFSSLLMANESISIENAMSYEERKATGIIKASPSEQKAFLEWLEKWTKETLKQAPFYTKSQPFSAWISSWPICIENGQKAPIKEKIQKTLLQKICQNMNGKKIRLQGQESSSSFSVWKIVSFDQPFVKIWQRDDLIEIRENKRDLSRPYILFNITKKEQAGATLEKKEKEAAIETSQTCVAVSSINALTSRVALSDGSFWKIAPMDQIIIQNNWRIGDRIEVKRSLDTIYRYEIQNLDSGDSVLSIEMQKKTH